jgi:hypothetical protein
MHLITIEVLEASFWKWTLPPERGCPKVRRDR